MSYRKLLSVFAAVSVIPASSAVQAATIVLYDQDFENPVGYNNDGGDVSIFRNVNQHYGGQPPGFSFAQRFTVETLNVTGSARGGGTAAFGTGWSDPSGIGGDYAIGMLANRQSDLLGLSFDVGNLDFLNFRIDVSSIDLSTFSGPFVPDGAVPTFRFSLFDNPTGNLSVGTGTLLDQVDFTGTASAREVFDWSRGTFGLSTAGNTNGNVTFQIDLLPGAGYGAFDNLRIAASDDEGDVGDDVSPVPLPASALLLGLGIASLGRLRRRKQV
ncbi:VPLPA-CTERM sorting domain-containing protein [Roseobacter cerasinus]|uniref:VPLPA-CTERM sorting domain-containing protein n=1 Tax=Roseobacter cerasinus TaxID=2602289 RepID=UPI001359EB98|nr:VPLPA-CTERM sorting domain-containing protein [Roseobacter cerasinus]